ncbi:MAG: 5'-3' exonuclease H3TH domain-containing protein [Microgenomates group bacterium]
MSTLLLIDGNAIMHRAFHALPPLKTKDGFPTNAIFGFISTVNKVVSDYQPNYLVVCFDTPTPTFRKKIFEKYQAQRPKLEDDLVVQFPIVKQALDAAGIFHLEKPGYEADDLIGTISNLYKQNDIRVLIVSGDRDILQLVDKNIFVITPQIGYSESKIYDRETVKSKFNISPNQIPDFKALVGDPSDNYPGAKGIGPKTAAKLLNQFGTVEEIFKNLEKIDKKTRKVLQQYKEDIFLSYQLAKIITNVPVNFDIEKAKFEGFNQNLKEFLLKYGIKSLTERIFKTDQKQPTKYSTDKKISNDNQIKLF